MLQEKRGNVKRAEHVEAAKGAVDLALVIGERSLDSGKASLLVLAHSQLHYTPIASCQEQ